MEGREISELLYNTMTRFLRYLFPFHMPSVSDHLVGTKINYSSFLG